MKRHIQGVISCIVIMVAVQAVFACVYCNDYNCIVASGLGLTKFTPQKGLTPGKIVASNREIKSGTGTLAGTGRVTVYCKGATATTAICRSKDAQGHIVGDSATFQLTSAGLFATN